jgi:HEAT repeat protein
MIMNELLQYLAGGDLRSDGNANEVARIVLDNPDLICELLDGLNEPNDVVRGRTADALEKVSRDRPEYLLGKLSQLMQMARHDPVPMVRWHAAMILTNLLALGQNSDKVTATLVALLVDPNAFVKSWAITGLCILGRKYPKTRKRIIASLSDLQRDASIAVRHRATKALRLLTNDQLSLPAGWIKSRRLTDV